MCVLEDQEQRKEARIIIDIPDKLLWKIDNNNFTKGKGKSKGKV